MASTLETAADLFKLNYEEGLGEGRRVLITASEVLLEDKDVYNFIISKSNSALKKDGFNRDQIQNLDSKLAMNLMDVSMLDVIIKAYGEMKVGGTKEDPDLEKYLKELKQKRNEYAHENHTWTLNRSELEGKLDALQILYEKILEKLKSHCHGFPSSLRILSSLDLKIRQMKDKLDSLKDTLFDQIERKSVTHFDSLDILQEQDRSIRYRVYQCNRK